MWKSSLSGSAVCVEVEFVDVRFCERGVFVEVRFLWKQGFCGSGVFVEDEFLWKQSLVEANFSWKCGIC